MTTSDVHTTPSASKNHNRRVAIVSAALVAGLLGSGALVLRGTEAVFSANTSNGVNSWTAASVALNTDLAATIMFKPSDAKLIPGTPVEKCIEVQYTGDVATAVKLYTASISDADSLGSAVDLKVEQGTGTAGINCAGFSEDAAAGGYAAGHLYNGTLANFGSTSTNYGNGVGLWSPSTAENKMYKFTTTLQSGAANSLQGKTLTATFRWEAQAGS